MKPGTETSAFVTLIAFCGLLLLTMTSRVSVSPLTTAKRTYGCGRTSTKGFTVALMKRLICGRSGSLDSTRRDLEMGPEKLLVSTDVTIFPSLPGLMTLSKEATVHPQ